MGKRLTSHGDANLRIFQGSRVTVRRFDRLIVPSSIEGQAHRPKPTRWTDHASQSIGILALGTMLTACVMPRAAEGPVHTYLLNPEKGTWAAQPSGNKHEPQEVLLLSMPQAEAGYDTPRMVYLTRAHEVAYYATNQWAETPARMIGTLLVQALEKSGLWRVV